MAGGQIEAGPTWTGLHNSHQPGETLVRNILYAKLFLRERLGVDAVGCTRSDLPDYTPQEAQIFARSGVPFIQMTRQGPRDQRLFWAESPDGSRVLVWADNPMWNAGRRLRLVALPRAGRIRAAHARAALRRRAGRRSAQQQSAHLPDSGRQRLAAAAAGPAGAVARVEQAVAAAA